MPEDDELSVPSPAVVTGSWKLKAARKHVAKARYVMLRNSPENAAKAWSLLTTDPKRNIPRRLYDLKGHTPMQFLSLPLQRIDNQHNRRTLPKPG
jgi:hypothetical protein